MFDRIALIGCGLIGSSLAHGIKRKGLAKHLTIVEKPDILDRVRALKVADDVLADAVAGVEKADLIIICTPQSAYKAVAEAIGSHIKSGTIVSDVGSVKKAAIDAVQPHLRSEVHLIPGHPIAGTENSGPEA